MRLLTLQFLKVCFYCLTFLWLFPRKVMNLWRSDPKIDDDDDDDDEWDCEYDSTWEDEDKTFKKKKTYPSTRSRWSMYAAMDMQDFRRSVRNLDDTAPKVSMNTDKSQGQGYTQSHSQDHFYNLEFYKGSRISQPDGVRIYEFHKEWKGKYDRLEGVHSYIQWLFPIQEKGMNWQSYVLTKEEIKQFREDEEAKGNLLKSYELMLDFYGIRLVNNDTGEVERADNWRERFNNLNRNTHNNLRITRILKCLGLLGFQHFQEKLVRFFLQETLVEKRLSNVKQSVLDYFIFAVLDKSQRRDLIRFAYCHYRPQKDFVWGPKEILLHPVPGHESKAHEERKRTPSSSNTEENSRKITNGQKSESSQSNHAMREENPGVSGDQKTSNKGKDKGQVKGEDHQVSSTSPQGGEKNGVDSHDRNRRKSNIR